MIRVEPDVAGEDEGYLCACFSEFSLRLLCLAVVFWWEEVIKHSNGENCDIRVVVVVVVVVGEEDAFPKRAARTGCFLDRIRHTVFHGVGGGGMEKRVSGGMEAAILRTERTDGWSY